MDERTGPVGRVLSCAPVASIGSAPELESSRGRAPRWVSPIVLAVVAAAVAFNVSARLVQSTLCCGDDALFAVPAKNLAFGEGYLATFPPAQTRAHDVRLFDTSATTTGPTLVVPVAAAIHLFGNRYWVPGAVTALASVALLAALAATWRRLLGPDAWLALTLLIVILQLVTIDHYVFWFTLLGELPASLLVVLAASLLAGEARRPRRAFAAGLGLGAAILTKSVAAIGVAAIAATLAGLAVAALWTSRRGTPRPALVPWRALFAGGLGCVLPLAAFDAWKLSSLGWSGYVQLKADERLFLASHDGSGIGYLTRAGLDGVATTLHTNWGVLAKFLGGSTSEVALLAALTVGVVAFRRAREPAERLVLLLAAAALAHAGWWLFISFAGWTRHLAPGLVYLCAATAVAVRRWPLDRRAAALAALMVIALAPRSNRLGEVVARAPYFEPDPRTRAMLLTAAYLEGLEPGHLKAATSWASVQDLEYLAPGSRNFVQYRFVAPRDRPGTYLVGSSRWDAKSRKLAADWQQIVDAWGGELVFEAKPYMVYRSRIGADPGSDPAAATP